ncbi:MAG: prolyl aminopeptidase [Alphaproteobacteria bacterium]|nr:prolyl aminopeptidase [Alphaproteobacteria bacterium]
MSLKPETTAPEAQGTAASATYPPLDAFDAGTLELDDIHTMHYEQSGNPDGVPVVFLHGGPGAGSSPRHRQFFDPKHYRIVIFDQRGCGKSTPHAELRANTTEDLIADIEKLRAHLGLDRCHVFGGSWGSTLALAYAIAHPQAVISLVLRGIFLMTGREIDWFLTGMGTIFPEAQENFLSKVPPEARQAPLAHYYAQLTSDDERTRLAAAQAWAAYETRCCLLRPQEDLVAMSTNPADALPIARIEAHYFVNNRFKPENYLLENIGRIRHIPSVIVQGRYDVICPIETAYALHKAWPEAEFVVVPEAGHSAFEPAISAALVRATDGFRSLAAG